jgi:hypothetical protein
MKLLYSGRVDVDDSAMASIPVFAAAKQAMRSDFKNCVFLLQIYFQRNKADRCWQAAVPSDALRTYSRRNEEAESAPRGLTP